MIAAMYARRSVSKDPSKEVSREAQEAACQHMAGGAPLALYVDWNISGGTTRRPDYQRLRADIEAGKVGAVYAYSISRLARSARELLDFLDVCKAHDVAVQTDAEGPIGGRGAFAKFTLLMMAGIAEMERDLASERTLAAHAVRRERGDHIGPAFYGTQLADRDAVAHGEARPLVANPQEPFEAVVAAYIETRSLHATARKLNTDGVPTKHGGPWRESSLRKMLRARAPEVMPTVKGARPASRGYLFTGLLRCPHDDAPLSPKANHRRWVAYHCPLASANASHPRPFSVAESKLLPVIQAEAAHLRPLDPNTGRPLYETGLDQDAPDNAARRADLNRQRVDILDAQQTRLYSSDPKANTAEAARRVRAVDDQLAALDAQEAGAVLLPEPISWKAPAAETNAALRAAFRSITLGADLLPKPFPDGFAWTVPEWRTED
jgi:DNA invertase Pin-like site-specific DNA recombinase